MLAFLTIVFAIVCTGYGALQLLRRWTASAELETSEPLELITASALVGLSLWLAANWVLALTHSFTRPALLTVCALFVIAGAIAMLRAWPRLRAYEVERSTGIELVAAIPLLCWTVFAFWRGSILPPLTHDALAYHLPKAVMILRAQRFDYFVAPDTRISHLPANYELLLADVLLGLRSDRLTELIGTVAFILFLLAAGAVAQRWWRTSRAALPAILAVAVAPVVILHSSADKNDLLWGFFALCALLFGARWAAEGRALSFMLLTTALTCGAGTKPQQAAVLLGLAPFLLRRVFADVRKDGRAVLRYGGMAVAAVLWFGVTGGAAYAFNALHESSPLDVQIAAGDSQRPGAVFQWGDWRNVWQFPYLLLTVPFSRFASAVWVPWRGEYWFWPHYEIYFSHYGMLTSLLVLLVPYCVYRFRRVETTRASERFAFTIAALVAFFFTLPVQFRPFGFFAAFPRYLLYILPVIVCWTLVPLDRFALPRFGRHILLAALTILFSWTAIRCARLDQFAPWQFVRWTAERPDSRVPYFSPNRAASIADRLAGPQDQIAIDGSFDTWTYPAYGEHLTRDVRFITSAAEIPETTRWVIIDRSWHAAWGNPQLTDMGKFWRYILKGQPLPADVRVFNELMNDSRFALIFRDKAMNQAVFWRRVPGEAEPKPRTFRFRGERAQDAGRATK